MLVAIGTDAQVTISGKIKTELGNSIPGVIVTLTGDDSLVAITSNDGLYSFNVSIAGNYVITPTKNYDSPNNKGITMLDLLLIRQHVLLSQSLITPYKIIAADGNRSSSITALDILLSKALILGTLNTFTNGRLWEFVSSDFTFIDSLNPFPFESTRTCTNIQQSLTNQDFIGVKLGDVDNSWDRGRCDGISTITDIDGNIYNVVEIGDQCWMKENLRVSHYADGSLIVDANDVQVWRNINYQALSLTVGSWCYYGTNPANDSIFGKLYGWATTIDPHGLCPSGWHIPSENEWIQLIDTLGGWGSAGGKMKSDTLWRLPNTGASNSSGFSALPGGKRTAAGSFFDILEWTIFWSSTPSSTRTAYNHRLYYYDNWIDDDGATSKGFGHSCRCIRD